MADIMKGISSWFSLPWKKKEDDWEMLDDVKEETEEEKKERIINYSHDCIRKVTVIRDSTLPYGKKYYKKVEQVLELINKIHNKCISDEKISIQRLERYHLQFTEQFISTFEIIFKGSDQQEEEVKELSEGERNIVFTSKTEDDSYVVPEPEGEHILSIEELKKPNSANKELESQIRFKNIQEIESYIMFLFNIIHDDDFVISRNKGDAMLKMIRSKFGISKNNIKFLGYRTMDDLVYFSPKDPFTYYIINFNIRKGLEDSEQEPLIQIGEVNLGSNKIIKFSYLLK